MIAWIIYILLVSVLVVLAAHATESLGTSMGYPRRWVWLGTAVLIVGLAATVKLRVEPRGPAPVLQTTGTARLPESIVQGGWSSGVTSFIRNAREQIVAPMVKLVQRAERGVSAQVRTYAVSGWVMASVSVAALIILVQYRFVRERRRWPVAKVQGVKVRIAPDIGPVVIGVARPEIVLPRWLLARAPEEQRLAIAHEAEHVRARDTLLLAGGCFVVAAMPWNPIAWYVLSRLRLAVELDCDARVLRAGAAPHSYGSLLIDVAERNARFRLGVPALADDSSHLHQRILAMSTKRPRFFLARAAASAALAFGGLLAACNAELPTAAEVDRLDAAGAERTATKLAMLPDDGRTTYIVDGRQVNVAEARAISASDIQGIEVKKGREGGTIVVRTKASPEQRTLSLKEVVVEGTPAVGIAHDAVELRTATREGSGGTPVIFIDGVKRANADLRSLNAEDILEINVIKGMSAMQITNDPDAVNGVIFIKTKTGNP